MKPNGETEQIQIIDARINRISSNFVRAKQYEDTGDRDRELRHLLWASEGMADILLNPSGTSRYPLDHPDLRKSYAVALHHTTARIVELVRMDV